MKKDYLPQTANCTGTGRLTLLLGVVCIVFFSTIIFDSCSSIECPVQNTVATVYACGDTLKDTLTVKTVKKNGKDTILLNQKINATGFQLPVSYQHQVDTLLFTTQKLAVTDTVWVEKSDMPHFESVDCGMSYFHELRSVRCTQHGIDSIVITKSFVDYDLSNAHFLIYFKNRD